jgi:hypothetical protein
MGPTADAEVKMIKKEIKEKELAGENDSENDDLA